MKNNKNLFSALALIAASQANATIFAITYEYTQDMAYAVSRPLTTATPDPNNDVSAANGYGSVMNCDYTAPSAPCVDSIPIAGIGWLNTDTGEIRLGPIDMELIATSGSIAYPGWSQTLTGSFSGNIFSMTAPATVNGGTLLCEFSGSSACTAQNGVGADALPLQPPQDVIFGPAPCPFCPPPEPTVQLIEEIVFNMLTTGGTGQYYYEANSSPDYTDYTINITIGQVIYAPVPAAVWMFGSALLGLLGIGRHCRVGQNRNTSMAVGSLISLPVALLFLLLGGCSDSGGDNRSGDAVNPSVDGAQVQGYAVKGPLNGATAFLYSIDLTAPDLKNTLINQGSVQNGVIEGLTVTTGGIEGPYLIEVTGGMELNGSDPVIPVLRSVVRASQLTSRDSNTTIVVTPLTTLVTELARVAAVRKNTNLDPGDDVTLSNLNGEVNTQMAFLRARLGLGLIDNINIFTAIPLLTSGNNPNDALAHRTAIEVIAALFDEIHQLTSGLPDEVFAALARDLSDGEIDGAFDGDPIPAFSGVDMLDIARILNQSQNALAALTVPGTTDPVSDLNVLMAAEADLLFGTLTPTPAAATIPRRAIVGTDSDGDGVIDMLDEFPNNAEEWIDTDGDCQSALLYTEADYLTSTAGNGCGDNSDAAPLDEDIQSYCNGAVDPNRPIANAGTSTPVNSPITFASYGNETSRTITLNGSASCDPNGDALTYTWTVISVPTTPGPNPVNLVDPGTLLSNGNTATPSFVANFAGDYVFQLVVSDGVNNSDPVLVTRRIDKGYYVNADGAFLFNTGLGALILLAMAARRHKRPERLREKQ